MNIWEEWGRINLGKHEICKKGVGNYNNKKFIVESANNINSYFLRFTSSEQFLTFMTL